MPPRPAHTLPGGRDFRRVAAVAQNDATGTGTGSSGGGGGGGGASYIVKEEDGTSKLTLEEGGGSLKTEESS